MRLPALAALALVATAAAAPGAPAEPGPATPATASPPHHPPLAVSARLCGSALYGCTPRRDGPALPSVCVNLCVKGADPPKAPLPEGACGSPCTDPAEACVLAAAAAAASVGTGGGGGETAADAVPAAPPVDAPLTHADFEAAFERVRGAEPCPLVVS